ncbi:hypothetical protein ACJZ2D_016020 [Fusarium nematophilum]
MSQPDKECKRLLSPQYNGIDPKRPRSIYLVESPSGTMREMEPAENHPPAVSGPPASGSPAPEALPSGSAAAGSPASGPAALGPTSLGSPAPDYPPPEPPTPETSSVEPSAPVLPASRRQENEPSLERRPPRKHANQDLTQEHLSTLSIRDKLRKGIAMGFANNLAYETAIGGMIQRHPRVQPQPQTADAMTVAGIMKRLDVNTHVDPEVTFSKITKSITEAWGESDTVSKELTDKRPGANEPHHLQEKKYDHFGKREPYLLAASQRLQAVTGTANFHRFAPCTLPQIEPGWCMLVEDCTKPEGPAQMGNSAPGAPQGLMAFLWMTSRKAGYRKLELDTIIFKENRRDSRLTLASLAQRQESAGHEEIFRLDADKGSITLYETTIISGPGQSRSWTWFRICKPLLDTEGPVPDELANMPDSILVFAIPTSQIQKDPDHSARLGDFGRLNLNAYTGAASRQLSLEWRFSRNGIPSFAISSHPYHIQNMGLPRDFLWVDCAPHYTGGKGWWDIIRSLAMSDKHSWERVQHQMATFLAMVEVKSKPGAGWIQVAPEPLREDERTMGSDSGPALRRPKTRMRQSGLRNEVRRD